MVHYLLSGMVKKNVDPFPDPKLVSPGDTATTLPRDKQRFRHREKARETLFSGIRGRDRA
jgi:hypothetical protein